MIRVAHGQAIQAVTGAFTADALMVLNNEEPPFLEIEVRGEPRVQERMRLNNQGIAARLYDPSARLKTQFKQAVRDALTDLGISAFPFYGHHPITIRFVFGVANMARDIDNLLKFVMDALETVVYGNDRMVVGLVAVKRHTPVDGFTLIQVEPFAG